MKRLAQIRKSARITRQRTERAYQAAKTRNRRLNIYRANERITQIRRDVLIYELPPRVRANMKNHTLANAEAHLEQLIRKATDAVRYLKQALSEQSVY